MTQVWIYVLKSSADPDHVCCVVPWRVDDELPGRVREVMTFAEADKRLKGICFQELRKHRYCDLMKGALCQKRGRFPPETMLARGRNAVIGTVSSSDGAISGITAGLRIDRLL